MFRHVNVPILGIIENMSGFTCPKCGENTPIFKEGGGAALAKQMGLTFLGGIPIDPELMASGDDGVPLLEKTADSPAGRAFIDMAVRFKSIAEQIAADAKEPKSIGLTKTGDMQVEWPDGFGGSISPYDLRINCPCALCVDEETGKRTLDPDQVPLDVKIGGLDKVGRYAVSITFSDGHNTGIFKFDRLRALAEKQKDSAGKSFNV
jgi:ATP-binding protein involved in chromosome partitioning